MSKKKKINLNPFPEYLLRNWEANDGVNFAIALSRITGWLLHVDWLTPTDNRELVENMIPLRVYVGNNSNHIFDIRGKQTIATFSNNIILPIIKQRGKNYLGVVTRYYSEKDLLNLPLRVNPDNDKINEALAIINNSPNFLDEIPKRKNPKVPAHIAARFTFGYCNPFASALSDSTGNKAFAMIARKYNKLFEGSKLGYAHSIVIDDDGNAIDIWGKDKIEHIAERFGIIEYEIDESEHNRVNQVLKQNSLDKYTKLYDESLKIIQDFFQ